MKKKVVKIAVVFGLFLGATMVVYAITSLFFTSSETSKLSKKTKFKFDLTTDMTETDVGPGDSFDVKPVINSDATEEMYAFIQVNMPITAEGELYTYDVDDGWTTIIDNEGTFVYAYADSEMTVLQPGESTSALTEQMTMDEISNAEYASIDDINITITGYAIGTEDVATDPVEAWEQCKAIENIQ